MSFFFVKQKTAYEMRISDGSSDVCSSDLPDAGPEQHTAMLAIYRGAIAVNRSGRRFADESVSYKLLGAACLRQEGHVAYQVFDEAYLQNHVRDRKSVVSGKSVSVREDLADRRFITKKNKKTTQLIT